MIKARVQHPKVQEGKRRDGWWWFFRYWDDEVQPDSTVKQLRRQQWIAPSRGESKITKREAEAERDKFLGKFNGCCATPVSKSEEDAILFGKLAELWRKDYVENPKFNIAASTKAKYLSHLDNHIMPRWRHTRISQFRAKDVIDWLTAVCDSWYMMADLRNIMSGIFTKAQEWEIIDGSRVNPMSKVSLPKKWKVRPERILDEDETVRVLARLEDPHLLVAETCIATGARISEVLGLKLKHVDLDLGTIRIEQRSWHGDIDEPKTEKSKRMLALGRLVQHYHEWIAAKGITSPEAWVFPQIEDPTKPMWDSGVRTALKKAAVAEGCHFEGLGPHSLRRANITWRQEVGGSSIETSKIAGHASTRITEEYTVVQLKRQAELTRRIQDRLAKASKRAQKDAKSPQISMSRIDQGPLATTTVQ
jgi:integrase